MNDKVYWSGHNITVSSGQLVVRSSVYPLPAVTSVHLEKLPKSHWENLFKLAILGASLLIFGPVVSSYLSVWGGGLKYMGTLFTVVGALAVILCVLSVMTDTKVRIVRVVLNSGQEARMKLPSEQSGRQLFDALNAAQRDYQRGSIAPIGLADELARLAGLVEVGIITADEWDRAKALFLGKATNRREEAIALLKQLHELRYAGVLSESEYNMKKWDVLTAS